MIGDGEKLLIGTTKGSNLITELRRHFSDA